MSPRANLVQGVVQAHEVSLHAWPRHCGRDVVCPSPQPVVTTGDNVSLSGESQLPARRVLGFGRLVESITRWEKEIQAPSA
mgnify:CR=1 FL=1